MLARVPGSRRGRTAGSWTRRPLLRYGFWRSENSITQAEASQFSYRYALWTRMVDAGLSVDLVGSHRVHFDGTPAFPPSGGQTFDPDHEGHWGWRADEILTGRGSGALLDWLGDYDADVVLMHLGTNDVFRGDDDASTVEELREIVSILRSDNPAVVILWAMLIPADDPAIAAGINELNALAEAAALELDTPQSPIRIVELNQGFDPVSMTYDGVHPNIQGEEWMADRWFAALEAMLP